MSPPDAYKSELCPSLPTVLLPWDPPRRETATLFLRLPESEIMFFTEVPLPHHHELVTAWSVSLFCAFHIAHCPTFNRFPVNELLGEWDLPIMTSKRLGTGHVISEEDSRDSEVTTCMTAQSCLTLWDPQRLQPARLLCPWNSPGKNTGMGSHALLQGIFPTPGIEPRSLALAGRFSTTEPREKPRVAMPLNNMWPEN